MTQILVIEDDPTQRLLTSSVLRSAGYEVVEAVDGAQGLELARQSAPDLIVCDVMMPGLNGYQLVEALKRKPALATIPVIMLTALSERAHVRVGMTAGADDYLFKPFRATELRASAAALLAKRDAQRSQFARDAQKKIDTALQAQKDKLTLRYEVRLHQELNGRWNEQTDINTDVCYDHATVLIVDLFGVVLRHFSGNGSSGNASPGSAVRRAYQAASDSLYLFGARHLVVAGDDLLAVFVDADSSIALSSKVLAARAAFGLQKMMTVAFSSLTSQLVAASPVAGDSAAAAAPSITVSLHCAALQLIHISDPLHGDGLTLAAGAALDEARALNQTAMAQGWQVGASRSYADSISELVFAGDRAMTSASPKRPALDAVELVPRWQV